MDASVSSMDDNLSHLKRLTSMVSSLSRNTWDNTHTQTRNSRKKAKVSSATMCSNEVLILDDSVDEDDKLSYTIQLDNTIDDSVMYVSTDLTNVSNLANISPVVCPRPTRHKLRVHAEAASYSCNVTDSSNHHRRLTSSVDLENTQDNTRIQRRNCRKKEKVPCATSSNEILILDDTVEEDKSCYTVQSDNKESVPLMCPICLEALSSKVKPITTRCGHLFCSECLQAFLRTNNKCPTCKATITLKSCTRLYL